MILAFLATTTVAAAYITIGESLKISWVYGNFSRRVNDVS